ncbi:hypothetical protein [Gorillibacterium sp. sgz5001074]|uniref:hypothetical protein n=1 Tax=Gorillibacterium sp. sgz5001074 TaxID=3446695 RepID=UPI003F663931
MPVKYRMPGTLRNLVKLDNILDEQFGSTIDDYLGFGISFDNEEDRYECTPEDAIIFGSTGVDGDHFAFATFGGSIHDLEEAPILFIQPMDFGNEVKLVARNIIDLIAIYLSLRDLYILERISYCGSKEEFNRDLMENSFNSTNDMDDDNIFFINRLKKLVEYKEIIDVYDYITELKKDIMIP